MEEKINVVALDYNQNVEYRKNFWKCHPRIYGIFLDFSRFNWMFWKCEDWTPEIDIDEHKWPFACYRVSVLKCDQILFFKIQNLLLR